MANWVKSVPGGWRSTNELAWHPAYVLQPLSFISACVVRKLERSKGLLSDSVADLLCPLHVDTPQLLVLSGEQGVT